MRDYQRELEELRARIAGYRANTAALVTLRRQEAAALREVQAKREQMEKEQKDVDRLEKLTFASILASLRGSREEDISREQAEAWAARLKWQEAERQLADIRWEIRDREDRLRADADCEARYEALLREKEADLRAKDPALAARLAELEHRELTLTTQMKELQEAVEAGTWALTQLDGALSSLDSAEGWGTWDVFGGGLLTDIMKYQQMDQAQDQMAGVQNALRRYQAELADVAQTAAFDIQPGGFLSMADMFFDNIFTDWAVLDRIRQSQSQLLTIQMRVRAIQEELATEQKETRRELAALRAERNTLVEQA